jgi:hypothetical protein
MSSSRAEGIMFENITPEQREAFKRRTHAVDAALKSALIEPQPEAKKTSLRRLHLVPSMHLSHGGHAQVA